MDGVCVLVGVTAVVGVGVGTGVDREHPMATEAKSDASNVSPSSRSTREGPPAPGALPEGAAAAGADVGERRSE
jgi:hypothetical protein